MLEDGTVFHGKLFGATKPISGEVVFTTGMVGYAEAMTDASFQGQLLVFTQPLIGNYGIPPDERDEHGLLKYFESDRIAPSAVIVQDLAEYPSHWNQNRTLEQWMIEHGVPGLTNVDTRALATKIRERGVMLATMV